MGNANHPRGDPVTPDAKACEWCGRPAAKGGYYWVVDGNEEERRWLGDECAKAVATFQKKEAGA